MLRFDIPSLSMQLYACRPVQSGEELTIPYVSAFLPSSVRAQQLKSQYGIDRCRCFACERGLPSDMRRAKILQRSLDVWKAVEAWTRSPMPKTRASWKAEAAKQARNLLVKLDDLGELIQIEKLEGCGGYVVALQCKLDVHIALGDEEKCLQIGKALGRAQLARTGDEELCRLVSDVRSYNKDCRWKSKAWGGDDERKSK
jgi:hypothetical protein